MRTDLSGGASIFAILVVTNFINNEEQVDKIAASSKLLIPEAIIEVGKIELIKILSYPA